MKGDMLPQRDTNHKLINVSWEASSQAEIKSSLDFSNYIVLVQMFMLLKHLYFCRKIKTGIISIMGCLLAVTVAVRRQEEHSVPRCLGFGCQCLRMKGLQKKISRFVVLELFPCVLNTHLTRQS